jgi:hypothetical protein
MVRATYGNGRRTTAWRCPTTPGKVSKTGERPCGSVYIAAEPLEKELQTALFRYVNGMELAGLLRTRGLEDKEAGRVAARLAEIEHDLDRAADLWFRHVMDDRRYERTTLALQEEQRSLQESFVRLGQPSVLESYAGRPGVLERMWPELTISQRRRVMQAAFDHLVIHPKRHNGGVFDFWRVFLPSGEPLARLDQPAA